MNKRPDVSYSFIIIIRRVINLGLHSAMLKIQYKGTMTNIVLGDESAI